MTTRSRHRHRATTGPGRGADRYGRSGPGRRPLSRPALPGLRREAGASRAAVDVLARAEGLFAPPRPDDDGPGMPDGPDGPGVADDTLELALVQQESPPPVPPPVPPPGTPAPRIPRQRDPAWPPRPAGEEDRPPERRARLAVRERLPLWLRLRCGVEPRTLAALAVVLLVLVGFGVHHFLDGRPRSVPLPVQASGERPPAVERAGQRIVVDVAGKVRTPGVVELPRGARVKDALERAGVREGVDLSGLNRARLLVDGEQLLVGASAPPAAPPVGPAGGTAGATSAAGGRISLSSATPEQLETLPGVGPALARSIVDYRTEQGGFRSVDQLQDVRGIGPARLADIEPLVGP